MSLVSRYKFPERAFAERKNKASGVTLRKCNEEKMKAFPFLVYSKKMDGVYCLPCRLFPLKAQTGPPTAQLVNLPFHDWKRFHEKMRNHAGGLNSLHANCVVSEFDC